MTDNPTKVYKKTLLELPPEVAAAFASLGADTEIRNVYMASLRGLGWTLQSISDASTVTRERVRQIVKDYEGKLDALAGLPAALPLPEPPVRKVRKARAYVEPDPVKLARLLELQPAAQAVRSNSPANREEGEEYTRLLAEVHLRDGVPLYRLSKRLSENPDRYGKASHGALRFRLARYGYKLPKTGTSKVYTPIKTENRVSSQ